jgi:hypothetical protein
MNPEAMPGAAYGATTVGTLVAAAKARVAGRADADWARIEAAVASRAAALVEQNAHRAEDEPTERWSKTCSLVLAAFRELEPLVGTALALSILSDAMTAPFKAGVTEYINARFGISPDEPQKALSRISQNFKSRGEARFGKAFVYVRDVQNSNRSFTNIQRCFFNDFFRANGAAEVTAVFCAMDDAWASAIQEPRYGIRFELPTTLAGGSDACRFQFSRSSQSGNAAAEEEEPAPRPPAAPAD